MPGLLSCIMWGATQWEGAGVGVKRLGVMDVGYWWVFGPVDLPGKASDSCAAPSRL